MDKERKRVNVFAQAIGDNTSFADVTRQFTQAKTRKNTNKSTPAQLAAARAYYQKNRTAISHKRQVAKHGA